MSVSVGWDLDPEPVLDQILTVQQSEPVTLFITYKISPNFAKINNKILLSALLTTITPRNVCSPIV
jgi:hypothetical protein